MEDIELSSQCSSEVECADAVAEWMSYNVSTTGGAARSAVFAKGRSRQWAC